MHFSVLARCGGNVHDFFSLIVDASPVTLATDEPLIGSDCHRIDISQFPMTLNMILTFLWHHPCVARTASSVLVAFFKKICSHDEPNARLTLRIIKLILKVPLKSHEIIPFLPCMLYNLKH